MWFSEPGGVGPYYDNPLTPDHIRAHALKLMEPGKEYDFQELLEMISAYHIEEGGQPSENSNPREQFNRALRTAADKGHLQKTETGKWKRTDEAPEIRLDREVEAEALKEAEQIVDWEDWSRYMLGIFQNTGRRTRAFL